MHQSQDWGDADAWEDNAPQNVPPTRPSQLPVRPTPFTFLPILIMVEQRIQDCLSTFMHCCQALKLNQEHWQLGFLEVLCSL